MALNQTFPYSQDEMLAHGRNPGVRSGQDIWISEYGPSRDGLELNSHGEWRVVDDSSYQITPDRELYVALSFTSAARMPVDQVRSSRWFIIETESASKFDTTESFHVSDVFEPRWDFGPSFDSAAGKHFDLPLVSGNVPTPTALVPLKPILHSWNPDLLKVRIKLEAYVQSSLPYIDFALSDQIAEDAWNLALEFHERFGVVGDVASGDGTSVTFEGVLGDGRTIVIEIGLASLQGVSVGKDGTIGVLTGSDVNTLLRGLSS